MSYQNFQGIVANYYIDILSEANVCEFANLAWKFNSLKLFNCCVSFLIKLIGQARMIEGVDNLEPQVLYEVSRRSFIPICEI